MSSFKSSFNEEQEIYTNVAMTDEWIVHGVCRSPDFTCKTSETDKHKNSYQFLHQDSLTTAFTS